MRPVFWFFTIVFVVGCSGSKKNDELPKFSNSDSLDGFWLLKRVETVSPTGQSIANDFDRREGRMFRLNQNRAEWFLIPGNGELPPDARPCIHDEMNRRGQTLSFKATPTCNSAEYELVSLTARELSLRFTEKKITVTEVFSRIEARQWAEITKEVRTRRWGSFSPLDSIN